jgi:hypothetical protein
MPRWDRPLDHKDNPYGLAKDGQLRPHERLQQSTPAPGPNQARFGSEWGLWLSVAKAMALVFAVGMVLTNAMYGFFELLHLLGG